MAVTDSGVSVAPPYTVPKVSQARRVGVSCYSQSTPSSLSFPAPFKWASRTLRRLVRASVWSGAQTTNLCLTEGVVAEVRFATPEDMVLSRMFPKAVDLCAKAGARWRETSLNAVCMAVENERTGRITNDAMTRRFAPMRLLIAHDMKYHSDTPKDASSVSVTGREQLPSLLYGPRITMACCPWPIAGL